MVPFAVCSCLPRARRRQARQSKSKSEKSSPASSLPLWRGKVCWVLIARSRCSIRYPSSIASSRTRIPMFRSNRHIARTNTARSRMRCGSPSASARTSVARRPLSEIAPDWDPIGWAASSAVPSIEVRPRRTLYKGSRRRTSSSAAQVSVGHEDRDRPGQTARQLTHARFVLLSPRGGSVPWTTLRDRK